MSSIYYLDAVAGAGKTYTMARYVVQHVRAGKNFLIVMPTNKMVDDVEIELKKVDPKVIIVKFHGDVIEGSVTSEVYDHFNNPPDGSHVAIITAPCFTLLKHVTRPQDFHLIMDEVITVFDLHDPTLPENHRIFTDCVSLSCIGPSLGFSNLDVTDETKLRALADNSSGDDMYKVLQPLARLALSDDHLVYVQDSNYKSLLSGYKGTKKLLVFAVLRPKLVSKFASCVIMAARFKETLLHKLWSKMGIDFVEHAEMKASLRFTAHDNGHRVKFYYAYDQDWSKSTKDTNSNNLAECFIDSALKMIGDKRCLVLRNNNCKKTKFLGGLDNLKLLPGKSHGQNQYQHYDHVMVLAAYNLQLPAQVFLENMFRIDRESTKRSIMSYEIYQAVMRSSLRDGDSVTDKMVIVADKSTAEWLSSLFPGSTCQSLGLVQPTPKPRGRKKLHSSSAEKQLVSREKLKAERNGFVKEIELATEDNLRGLCLYERDEYTLESIGNNVSLFRGTIIRNIKEKNPDKSLYLSDEGPFVSFLRDRSKIKLENKEDNEAISPACFRHVDGKDSVTAGVNVWFANGIWLDLDRTDLKPSDLAKIFPNLKFLVYSTFSHTDDVRRLRVCFFTSDIMSNKHYRNIVHQIIHKVEATGSYVRTRDPCRPYMKAHGIDPKYDASNKFYLPCKPGDGGVGIFRVFDGNGRSPLNVDNWLENSVVPLEEEFPAVLCKLSDTNSEDDLTPLQSYIAEAALNKFRAAPKESGHFMFYNLHRRLLHNGIRGHHWHLIMSQAVGCARSKADRQKEMEAYMKDAA